MFEKSVGGFGADTFDIQMIRELAKSLEAGYGSPATVIGSLTGGMALVPQSIEPTLVTTQALMDEVKLLKKLASKPVFSTVHEYRRNTGRGQQISSFVGEGQLPPVQIGVYEAAFLKIKYQVDLRQVTDQMGAVAVLPGMGQNAIAVEDRTASENLLISTERALFWGDSRSNPLAFDGLRSELEQRAPNNISDLRGNNLTEERIKRDLARARESTFVRPQELWMSPTSQQTLSALRGGSQMFLDANGQPKQVGVNVRSIDTSFGAVPLDDNIYLAVRKAIATASSTSAPAMPGGGGAPSFVAGAVGGGETSLFGAADAGNYRYKIVAHGANGRSAPTASGAVAVAAGQKVTITVGSGNETGIAYFEIFKSPLAGALGDETWIADVAYNTGGATVYTDLHQEIGGTTWSFAVTYDPEIYKFVRLLDMMRREIPVTALARLFAYLLFGSPLVTVPTKLYAWKNVGQSG